MPLAEFEAPEITDEYLRRLELEHLLELLLHKTNGLIVAARINLTESEGARTLKQEVQKIQEEIKARSNRKDR